MPGNGSCLDKNDHALIRRQTRAVEALAGAVEDLAEAVDGEGD